MTHIPIMQRRRRSPRMGEPCAALTGLLEIRASVLLCKKLNKEEHRLGLERRYKICITADRFLTASAPAVRKFTQEFV